jgi:hypothetical protein
MDTKEPWYDDDDDDDDCITTNTLPGALSSLLGFSA